MAGTYNIKIEQNATYEKKIKWEDATGNTISFIGSTPKLEIKIGSYEGSDLLDLTPYLTNNNTYLSLVIPSSVTKTLTEKYNTIGLFYDLIIEKTGVVYRLMQGNVVVSGGVTDV